MAVLTEWEEKHLLAITHLIDDVERNERGVLSPTNPPDGTPKWIFFRNFMIGLYSALDFVWYFLYCHFCNKGEADRSSKAVINLNFPFAYNGVKTVVGKPDSPHDMTKKFRAEKAKLVLKETVASVWVGDVIGDIILKAQRTLETKENGVTVENPTVPLPNSPAESLFLLHYYRNCVAHRELIHIETTRMWIEVNRAKRDTKIVENKGEDTDNHIYLPIEKGDWVKLPDDLIQAKDHGYRPLEEVLCQLKAFVLNTIGQLLYSTRIISSQSEILACAGLTEFLSSRTGQQYSISITVDGIKYDATKSSEEECYIELLKMLSKQHGVRTPHLLFTPSYTALPFGPVEVEMRIGKKFQSMLNEMKQKLNSSDIDGLRLSDSSALAECIRIGLLKLTLPKCKLGTEQGTAIGKLEQYNDELNKNHKFEANLQWKELGSHDGQHSINVEMSINSVEMSCEGLKLISANCSGANMDAAKEKAASNLILKLKALKLLEEIPSTTKLTMIEIERLGKSKIKILQEFRDKLRSKIPNQEVNLDDPDPTKIAEQSFTSEIELLITSTQQDGMKVKDSFSGQGSGSSKQKAKDAAAAQVLDKLNEKGLIKIT